ncbi:uncharacterized protein LOC128234828 [Mya arenaria]|uniref:uncharacterized protein LOC128234828 n=1 Tax=Mya arenaria TaxID=6604 RepID=UPI0022E46A2A|nr:uncharacterized protein LOC128234828 [Mya arenaria]
MMAGKKKKENWKAVIASLQKALRETQEKIEEIKKEHSKELEERENQHSMELEERENQHSKEIEQIKKDHSKELKKTKDEKRSLLEQNKILREDIKNLRENKFPKGKDAGASGSPQSDKLEVLKFSDKITPLGEGSPTGFDIPAQKVEATDMSQGPKNVETCEQVEANNGSEMPRDPKSLKTGEDHNYDSKRERKSRTSVPSRKSRTVHVVKEPEGISEKTQGQNVPDVPDNWEDQREETDSSLVRYSCADDNEHSITPENQAATKESIPAQATNLTAPSQKRNSCYIVQDRQPFKDLKNASCSINELLKLYKNVHLEGILINNFSIENIYKIDGQSELKIYDPNLQATSMPGDDSIPMLERCKPDLILIVEFVFYIIKNMEEINTVGEQLDMLFNVFQEFKTDDIYSECCAFLEYFLQVSVNTKALHFLIKAYSKTPDFTFMYEGRNLHMFKKTNQSCMPCIWRNFSQEIQRAPLNDIFYLRQNAFFAFELRRKASLVLKPDWRLHVGLELVKAFERLEKAVYSNKEREYTGYSDQVKDFFRFLKNILSHLVEQRKQCREFRSTLSSLGIHNDIDFLNYIEHKIPKLAFHVFSGIYMYRKK